MKRAHQKGVTRMAVVVGVMVSAALFAASPAFATVTPTAKTDFTKGLSDGQTIKVSGTGFTAGATVAIVQCNNTVATGGGEAACDTSNVVTATVTSTGTVRRTSFTVATGTIGNGSCDASMGLRAAPCYVAVANVANQSQEALAKIQFGPYGRANPKTGLTNGQSLSVSGGGFTAGATVAVVECNRTVLTTGEAACNTGAPVIVTADTNGKVAPTTFTVTTGTIGNGTCSATAPNKQCYLAVANIANTAQTALVSITF